MTATTSCQHCAVNLEFDDAAFIESGSTDDALTGQKITCPICGHETQLTISYDTVAEQRARKEYKQHRPLSGMMTCPSCRSQVSKEASACPQCGHQFKNPGALNLKDPVHVIGLLVCGIFLLLIIVGSIAMFTH